MSAIDAVRDRLLKRAARHPAVIAAVDAILGDLERHGEEPTKAAIFESAGTSPTAYSGSRPTRKTTTGRASS
jgi:hypothetical protein